MPNSDIERLSLSLFRNVNYMREVDDGSRDDRSERKYWRSRSPSILFLLQLRDNKTIIKLTVKFSLETARLLFLLHRPLNSKEIFASRHERVTGRHRESRLVINLSLIHIRSLTHTPFFYFSLSLSLFFF